MSWVVNHIDFAPVIDAKKEKPKVKVPDISNLLVSWPGEIIRDTYPEFATSRTKISGGTQIQLYGVTRSHQ